MYPPVSFNALLLFAVNFQCFDVILSDLSCWGTSEIQLIHVQICSYLFISSIVFSQVKILSHSFEAIRLKKLS